jgi:uncharacterized protein YlzI (FlbEa/FlbD family)
MTPFKLSEDRVINVEAIEEFTIYPDHVALRMVSGRSYRLENSLEIEVIKKIHRDIDIDDPLTQEQPITLWEKIRSLIRR